VGLQPTTLIWLQPFLFNGMQQGRGHKRDQGLNRFEESPFYGHLIEMTGRWANMLIFTQAQILLQNKRTISFLGSVERLILSHFHKAGCSLISDQCLLTGECQEIYKGNHGLATRYQKLSRLPPHPNQSCRPAQARPSMS